MINGYIDYRYIATVIASFVPWNWYFNVTDCTGLTMVAVLYVRLSGSTIWNWWNCKHLKAHYSVIFLSIFFSMTKKVNNVRFFVRVWVVRDYDMKWYSNTVSFFEKIESFAKIITNMKQIQNEWKKGNSHKYNMIAYVILGHMMHRILRLFGYQQSCTVQVETYKVQYVGSYGQIKGFWAC